VIGGFRRNENLGVGKMLEKPDEADKKRWKP
jgi:hypothetical protein